MTSSQLPIQVFVDTSMFKALVDKKDDFHHRATRLWSSLKDNGTVLYTSNYILDESFTLIRSRCGIETVLMFRDSLAESTHVLKIIKVSTADEGAAWEWFTQDWRHLSFTDCVSFAVMRRLELSHVATFNSDFTRAGFKMVE